MLCGAPLTLAPRRAVGQVLIHPELIEEKNVTAELLLEQEIRSVADVAVIARKSVEGTEIPTCIRVIRMICSFRTSTDGFR